MTILVTCPHCQLELEAEQENIGNAAVCPECARQFIVELPQAATPKTSVFKLPGKSNAVDSKNKTKQKEDSNPNSPVVSKPGAIKLPKSTSSPVAPAGTVAGILSTPNSSSGVGEEDAEAYTDVPTRGGSSNALGNSGASPDAESGKKIAVFKGLDTALLAELSGGAEPQKVASYPTPNSNSTQKRSITDASFELNEKPTGDIAAAKSTSTPIANPLPTPIGSTPEKRKRKSAKLLTEAVSESKLQMGADGKLPELKVVEIQNPTANDKVESDQSPLTMIIVLCISVGVSVLLLFAPTDSVSTSSDFQFALDSLEQHYIGTKPPLKPYQVLLREAIQFENTGNRQKAKANYRKIVDMILAERRNTNTGLTAPKFSASEPNDKMLEQHLKVLLSH